MSQFINVQVQCDSCSRWQDVSVFHESVERWPMRLDCSRCKAQKSLVVHCELLPEGTPHVMQNCFCQRVERLRAKGVTNIGSKLLHGWTIQTLEHSVGIV